MKSPNAGIQFPAARAAGRKRGCAGCLVQCLFISFVAAIFLILLTGIFNPWAFYLGGKFHVLPYWQGWGRMHSKISGDYALYVQMEPGMPGRWNSIVKGSGYVCTPRGEQIRLTLYGTMRKHLNLSTDGEAIKIGLSHKRWLGISPQRRPRISLNGRWQNPNLVANDEGSISYAFQPDGRVYEGNDPNRPHDREILPITLTNGSYSDFKSACSAIRANSVR